MQRINAFESMMHDHNPHYGKYGGYGHHMHRYGRYIDQLMEFVEDKDFVKPVIACNATAAAWVRAAFHDAGTYSKSCGRIGGADGSLQYEIDNEVNAPLAETISFFQDMKYEYPKVSMSDIITWGGIVSVKTCGGPYIPFKAGRPDAAHSNDVSLLPSDPDTPIEDYIQRFKDMGFDTREFVALVAGGHSLGGRNVRETGFDGTPDRFDNKICKVILEGKAVFKSDNEMGVHPETKRYIEEFAYDEHAFREAFVKAFVKMMELGVDKSRLIKVD
ncbi:hypothetical protein HK102_013419 [Quaeritorhiza haematococci]|nr:hypothetical protein HK102_013419 [Quaeritorhiza haematococci]